MSRIASERARAQMERILHYAALGVGGPAVVASKHGTLIAAAPDLGDDIDPIGLAASVLSEAEGPNHVDWISEEAALVTTPDPALASSAVHHHRARALELLRRMASTGGAGFAPGGNEPESGAPAHVGPGTQPSRH